MGDSKEASGDSSEIDEFKASETTDPDPTVGISVVEPLPIPPTGAPLGASTPPTAPRIEILRIRRYGPNASRVKGYLGPDVALRSAYRRSTRFFTSSAQFL